MATTTDTALKSPSRKIKAKVEFYTGSTLATTYTRDDKIISITIEQTGEQGKFFGFGICQSATIKLLDPNREIDVSQYDYFIVKFGVNDIDYTTIFPKFYVKEINRDENTNNLTIKGYDIILDEGTINTTGDLMKWMPPSYSPTIEDIANLMADEFGLTLEYDSSYVGNFETAYPNMENLNVEGTETYRQVLDDIAEATQSIYYISGDTLRFTACRNDQQAQWFDISKEDYFTFKSQPSRKLTKIVSATELGDNISATTGEDGETQYVRDNMFWELRPDIADLLQAAINVAGGKVITPFECEWRGNYTLSLCTPLAIVAKDNSKIKTYLLNQTLTYDGGLTSKISWTYPTNTSETESNPSTLGEVLNQTYARVDKANKQIDLVVSKVDGYDSTISQIQLDQNSINATVSNVSSRQDATDTEIDNITQKVNASITSNQVELIVQEELAGGVNKVTTTTGFTFNQDGLTISKSNVDITTDISEDGMRVSKDGQVVLTADNNGVEALNLHATTYLIIGENSRFEDYDNGSRTGCFWIGG